MIVATINRHQNKGRETPEEEWDMRTCKANIYEATA